MLTQRGRGHGAPPGRDREVSAVTALLDAACAGTGGVVLIEGEAGIGKTALMQRACRLAADRGMRVLHARGAELECELAFGVARELYGAVDRDLEFIGAAELAEPALRVGPAVPGDLFAVLHGLYWLTADLAVTAPLLVAVDDAHWCDEPTIRHLAYLARRLDGLAVALLVAARPATDPRRLMLLDAVASEPWTVVQPLGPLPEATVHEVVASWLGRTAEPEFSAACHAATGGNPFLLTELLAEAAGVGLRPAATEVHRLRALAPAEVQRSVLARIARLPDGATALALAQAIAVLGDGNALHRAARLARLTDTDAGPLADGLVTARILQPQPVPAFAHPLVRSAVAATLGPSATAAWHRRAAELIAAEGGGGDELVPHLLAGSPAGDPWVVATLREAARRATAQGAPDLAARYLSRALDERPTLADRAGLLHELGIAQSRAAIPDAHRTLTAALDLSGDPVERARIALDLLRSHFATGLFVEAITTCERVIGELGDQAPDLTTQLAADLMVAGLQDVRTRHSTSRRRLLTRPAPEPGGPTDCRMLAALALEEVLAAGSAPRAVDLAEKALVGRHLIAGDAIAVLPCAVVSLTLAGRVRRSLQVWDDLARPIRRRGDIWATAMAAGFRGHAAHVAGDLHRAISDTRMAIDLSRTHLDSTMTAYATSWLVYALIDAGDQGAAAAELDRFEVDAWPEASFAANYLLSARGLLRLAQGLHDDAIADFRECGRRLDTWQISSPAICPWRPGLALALFARGDRTAAAATADEALAAARHWGTPHVLVDALRSAGLIAGGAGGRALLEEAVAVAARGESPLEHAQALSDLGGALRRAGCAREAREPLHTAVDLAARCGAATVARQARDELVATGARPRRLRSSGAAALTTAQLRVATMAADGMTSREVAQALFVSEKTVETHLTQTYRKLGIIARAQLAEALAADG